MKKQAKEMLDYIVDFIEKPTKAFNDMPVCPFAKKARNEGRIHIEVMELSQDVLQMCKKFAKDNPLDVLIVMHPTKDGMTSGQIDELVLWLNQNLDGWEAFGSHPENTTSINGVYTRRDPYPNIQFNSITELKKWAAKLKKTKYYNNWTEGK
jgi:hypothetical protein